MRERIVVGLGSNRSYDGRSPVEILSLAVSHLAAFVDSVRVSSVYRTGALYVTDQEDFYNMVLTGLYDGTPHDLLQRLHHVEALLGRNRSAEIRNGPRSLDLDIEFFGRHKVNDSVLTVPHVHFYERAFTLIPFLEICRECADDLDVGIPFAQECAESESVKSQKIQLYMKSDDFLALKI